MAEIYKDIVGYENLYQVSSKGNIRSKDKEATYKGQSHLKGKVLKQECLKRNHTNYRRVTLSKARVTKKFQVHQLVAQAFLLNSDNKPHVNHIDNNGENNTVENLEWVTHSENMLHAQRQGRLHIEVARKIASTQTKDKGTKDIQDHYGELFVKLYNRENTKTRKRAVQFNCINCGELVDVVVQRKEPAFIKKCCRKCSKLL